ncbi:type VI secretion system protein TssA [Trinickia dabaoshanensis]|uniref:Type VI secretion system protein TssA n=1 Tax=Trinickia dabaoshanensis TaxID=564714 RepID=A0A2N7VN69_9BURK|nr:type VI secretion system protein TssA [Trinickia dabaoshanensis]PMS18621.1 type VI secretion system protein TssA [Trinickia dabaoshanensis]
MNPSDLIEAELSFAVDLQPLLSPLPEGEGVGVSLRSDPIWQQIRDAQREDDPSLPMGEWERPLIKADWHLVATLSADALRSRSKDFHLAVWLCDAWTRLYRLEGLMAGVRLLTELVDRYWDHAYPQMDGDDREARAAPLHWISRRLETVLKLHVPLIGLSVEPGFINLDDWQRVVAASLQDDDAPATALPREMLDREASQGSNLALLRQLERTAGTVLTAIDELARRLDQRLGDDAPSFTRVLTTLGELQRAARALRGDHALDEAATAALPSEHSEEIRVSETEDAHLEVEMQPRTLPLTRDHIVDRAHAYRLLEDIARYLAEHEPHSPTPYLLARAVSWGRMPLPELMRDIVSQEGDLGRYMAMLGVEP